MAGLTRKEVSYLKYKPELGIRKKILSTVNMDESYIPLPALDRLLDKSPSGLLGEINDAIDMSKMLQERINKCMEDFSIEGQLFSSYVNELKSEDGDKEFVRSFEKKNALAINGTSQVDVYPLLYEAELELEQLKLYLSNKFYNTDSVEDLLEASELDVAKAEVVLKKDMNNTLTRADISKLDSDSSIIEITSRKLENCKNLMKQSNILLCSTVNTYYNGNVDDIVAKFGEADIEVLEVINQANIVSFRKSAMLCEQDATNNKKLNNPDIKDSLVSLLDRVMSIKDDSDKMLSWALAIDTDYDQNAYTQIVEDVFDKVEVARADYDKAILEVFKQIKLDDVVRNDIVSSLQAKRYERQKVALISDIIQEKKNGSFNAEAFVDDKGLRSQGTLCSR